MFGLKGHKDTRTKGQKDKRSKDQKIKIHHKRSKRGFATKGAKEASPQKDQKKQK